MRLRRAITGALTWFSCALLAAASLAPALRAQTPANPLRRPTGLAPVVRTFPTPADPRTRPLFEDDPSIVRWAGQVADAIPQPTAEPDEASAVPRSAEPKSVVPHQFGKPELLSPESGAHGLPQDQLGFGPHEEDLWSQRLVHRWFAEPWFSHSDPNDPMRHVGLGQPLMGTSWRNRPLFIGAFYGGVITEDIIRDQVDQGDTAFMGLRLGGDFDHYWGVELRYAFAAPELTDGTGAALGNGHSRDYFVDVSLVHYPWGDAKWRPYILAGLGFQTYRFYNLQNDRVSESLTSIPIGIGLKYFCGPWFTLRFDVIDNIALGNNHLDPMHNFSFMAGGECRFGGRRQSYYPWHNNTSYK